MKNTLYDWDENGFHNYIFKTKRDTNKSWNWNENGPHKLGL